MNIAIVGAGVVGCAIAHELASRGARVQVVDARGTGRGATRASAGMLAPHIEGHMETLRLLGVRSLGLYDRFLDRVTADSGTVVEYERAGTLQIAVTADEGAALCQMARHLAAHGVAHEMLDATGISRLEPQLRPDVTSALSIPEHGYVAASALTDALAGAAVRHGASFTVESVLAIHGGDRARVVTATGSIEADAVIVAAGSWSGALTAGAVWSGEGSAGDDPVRAVKPIRGQLLHLRLPSRPASRVIWGSRCYVVPWRDGTVLVGATVEDVGFDETATAAGVQQLLAESAALMPSLSAAMFQDVRVGLRPMTVDELPAIGPSSTMPQVFYATGHYRSGVLLAPLTAALVADLVLDGRAGAELALVRPDRLGL